MSLDAVRAALAPSGHAAAIAEFPRSSATVAEAAQAIGTEPARIAKTISVYDESPEAPEGGRAILIVLAGDAKLSSGGFKRRFGFKPHMLAPDDVERLTGHAIGGVCPFANPESASVWLDESLRRFEVVWPATGSSNSAIGLTLADLEQLSGARGWVDVGRGWLTDTSTSGQQ